LPDENLESFMDWRDQTDENRLRPDLETLYSQISFVIWRPHV